MSLIETPGKFEGEPDYVPAFWDAVMDGGADEEFYDGETPVSVFSIGAEDAAKHPDLAARVGCCLLLWEDSQGFVRSMLCPPEHADKIKAQCEADSDADAEPDSDCEASDSDAGESF